MGSGALRNRSSMRTPSSQPSRSAEDRPRAVTAPGTRRSIKRIAMAYGLYTHIQSNKRRSIALLIGLFFLVYVMTFAGALLAEAMLAGNASLEWLLARGVPRPDAGLALGDHRHADLDVDRLQIPPVDDRCADRRARSHAPGAAAHLQSAREHVHLARHYDAEAQDHGEPGAQRLRHRAQREAIFDHRHLAHWSTGSTTPSSKPCSATS